MIFSDGKPGKVLDLRMVFLSQIRFRHHLRTRQWSSSSVTFCVQISSILRSAISHFNIIDSNNTLNNHPILLTTTPTSNNNQSLNSTLLSPLSYSPHLQPASCHTTNEKAFATFERLGIVGCVMVYGGKSFEYMKF